MDRLDTASGSLDLSKRRKEMAAFSLLGPLARAVIIDSPIDIDLEKMLAAFNRQQANARMDRMIKCGDDPDATPAERDKRLADFLTASIAAKVPGYKPIQRRSRAHG